MSYAPKKKQYHFAAAKNEAELKKIIDISQKMRQEQEQDRIRDEMFEAEVESKKNKEKEREQKEELRQARAYLDVDALETSGTDMMLYEKLIELMNSHPKEFAKLMSTNVMRGMEKQLKQYMEKQNIIEEGVEEDEKEVREEMPDAPKEVIDTVALTRTWKRFTGMDPSDKLNSMPKLREIVFDFYKNYRGEDSAGLFSTALGIDTNMRIRFNKRQYDNFKRYYEAVQNKVIIPPTEEELAARRTPTKSKPTRRITRNMPSILPSTATETPVRPVRHPFEPRYLTPPLNFETESGATPKPFVSVIPTPSSQMVRPGNVYTFNPSDFEEKKQKSSRGLTTSQRWINGLKKRLNVLVGQIFAGNTSPEIKSEIYDIIDFLLKSKVITKPEHKRIVRAIELNKV